jgi:hypothetical protein
MAIMGLEDEQKKRRMINQNSKFVTDVRASGITGPDDELYYPVLGMRIAEGGGGSSTPPKPMTEAEKAAAIENQKRTKAMFDAMQAEADAKAKAVAAAQEAAKAKAIADATAAGKSQAEIDKAAKNAQLKVLLDTGPIVGTAPPAIYVTPAQMEQTGTTIQTGPIIATKTPDFWDGLMSGIDQWNKGWNDFIANIKKTLNIK